MAMAVAIVWPAAALAMPATVRMQASVRTAPSWAAPVLGNLPGGERLEVSDHDPDGWRVVQLSRNRIGYLRDEDIALSGAGPAGPSPTLRIEQQAPPVPGHPITAWVAGGAGPALIGGHDSSAARVEVAVALGRHLLSLRYLQAEDYNASCGVDCMDINVSLPHNSVNEIAAQYGIRGRIPYLLGTASVGLAGLWTVQRGSTLLSTSCFFGCIYQFNAINGHAIGGTAEIGGYLTSRYVSFGPTAIVDVNTIQSVVSILIDLHVGWIGPPS